VKIGFGTSTMRALICHDNGQLRRVENAPRSSLLSPPTASRSRRCWRPCSLNRRRSCDTPNVPLPIHAAAPPQRATYLLGNTMNGRLLMALNGLNAAISLRASPYDDIDDDNTDKAQPMIDRASSNAVCKKLSAASRH
jgi:hypothetical protein